MRPMPCRHCHGTTFCGGYERNGTLWTSPACSTCLVKSGLPTVRRLHKVVCCVCGGTGDTSDRSRARLRSALLLFSGLLLFVLGLQAARSLPHPGEGEQPEPAEQVAQPAPRSTQTDPGGSREPTDRQEPATDQGAARESQ
jgi:hypothetical protein